MIVSPGPFFWILKKGMNHLILLQKEIAANLLEMNRVKQAAAKKKKVKPKVAPKPKPNPLKFPWAKKKIN